MSKKKMRRPATGKQGRAVKSADQSQPPFPGCILKRTLVGYRPYCAAWSPDEKRIATGSYDQLSIWSIATGKKLSRHTVVKADPREIRAIAWSGNGRVLMVGDSAGDLHFWEETTRGESADYIVPSDNSPIVHLSSSPDGTSLASCSTGGTIRIWDVNSHQIVATAPRGMSMKSLDVPSLGVDVCWTRDSSAIVIALANGEVCRFSTTLETLATPSISNGIGVAIGPNATKYAIGTKDGTIYVLHLDGDISPLTLEGHTGEVLSLAFTADGQLLASLSEDDTVRVWDCITGQQLIMLEELAWPTATAVSFGPRSDLLAVLVGEILDDIDLDESEDVAESQAVRIWELHRSALNVAVERVVHYLKAKVLLLGNTGVGKTCLGTVLNGEPFTPAESTHGRTVWSLDRQDSKQTDGNREFRETLLWDLAGQPSYRVVHQMHLSDTAVALVLKQAKPYAG